MKWAFVCVFVCLASYGEGGALRCTPGLQDTSCTTEELEKDLQVEQLIDSRKDAKETAAVEAECLAGSEWESNCHSCRCSETGAAICLRRSDCIQEVTGEPLKCKPNTTFVRECNTCVCLDNGLGLCTLETCRRSTIPKKSDLKPGKECAPGTFWNSQCNSCGCSPDGDYHCTKKDCPDQGSEPVMRCAPDTMWNNDCNTCWCTSDGRAMCTKMGCDNDVSFDANPGSEIQTSPEINTSLTRRKRGVAQELPKTCQPGQEFRMDCNKCLCDNEGQDFSCTRHDCTAMSNGNGGPRIKRDTSEQVAMECSPGSVFDKDCNVCRCTQDGLHATCTLKRCTKPEANKKDKDVNERVPDTDLNFRCNPGEQFKQGCNDCSCSADGKSVFCTVRYCDQDITPPPSV